MLTSFLHQMLAIVTVQGFFCKTVSNERWLNAQLTLECPLDNMATPLFVWTLLSTALYPVGIPVIIYTGRSLALCAFRLANMLQGAIWCGDSVSWVLFGDPLSTRQCRASADHR